MSKIKRYDGLPRVTKIPEGGTNGATLGVNLRDSSGRVIQPSEVLNPTDDGSRPIAATIWRLIREIPANIVKVSALAGTGFTTRGGDGEWHQRTLQQGTGVTVQNGDGVAGDPSIALADLANTGSGAALVKITRDAKGRLEGTSAATTSDLAEGANQYFTNPRADARIALQRGQPNGLADLDAGGKIPTARLPALAITETFVVASQAAQLALTAQEGDVAVRTDLSKNYIRNAGTAGTMADWTELLTPAAPVQSVNGKTGTVSLVTDDIAESGTPTNQWFTAARVRAVVLTGLSTATNAAIAATDSILAALGKLQAQITGLPKVLSGTYAARPAATAVTAGTTYTATDVRESYTSNGTAWALVPGAGVVLGAAERTTPFNTTSASLVDIPGMSMSFIVGERSFVAEFGADVFCNGANTDVMVVVLSIDGVSSAQLFCSGSIKSYTGMSRQILVSGKTPGSTVTCKLQCFATGGSTANVFGDPADKITLYVRNS